MTATQAPTPGPLSGDFNVEEYVADYEFRADEGSYSPTEKERALLIDAIHGALSEASLRLAPTAPVEASSQDDDLKLIIAHTIIEDLRVQHPGIEQIDNERGDVWIPGGSAPQSPGCVVDIHSVAQSVEQQVLAALRPGHTDLMVSPESIDAFLEANPPPVEASGSERETVFDGEAHDLVQTAQALAIAIERVPDWLMNDNLLTAHCHAEVLIADLSAALRPQPSGETREAVARELAEERMSADKAAHNECGTTPYDQTIDDFMPDALAFVDRILALLRPAAPDGGGLADLAARVTAEVKRGADGSHVQALGALSNIEAMVRSAIPARKGARDDLR